ncbi:hypothetical protein [Micromonospora craniellae]|uniref:hypothetical protein n=1 Tax=Micromonospora craniellae TaxID=2294034 RepID=UPI00168AEC69|nr:hypothetical protein [Micromonospora craniellae]QOC94340.1 hypothetical protein ID554_12530 [Micromonospora craniellae]
MSGRQVVVPRTPTVGGTGSSEEVWGWAVRREWRDGRHDLFGFTADRHMADRAVARDRGFWRVGPVRPAAVYVVAANASAVVGHPVSGCCDSSCPDSPERGEVR